MHAQDKFSTLLLTGLPKVKGLWASSESSSMRIRWEKAAVDVSEFAIEWFSFGDVATKQWKRLNGSTFSTVLTGKSCNLFSGVYQKDVWETVSYIYDYDANTQLKLQHDFSKSGAIGCSYSRCCNQLLQITSIPFKYSVWCAFTHAGAHVLILHHNNLNTNRKTIVYPQ